MENKKLTIWQRLSKTMGPDSLINNDYPTFKFDKEVLLKTTDKSEYEKEKLQAKQSKYLTGHWAKIENNLYQQSIYYGPTRLENPQLWMKTVTFFKFILNQKE